MAKFIGGPIHGTIMQNVTAQLLYVPVHNNERAPKQDRNRSWFLQCAYKRTRIVRDGEVIYRFNSGYYEQNTS